METLPVTKGEGGGLGVRGNIHTPLYIEYINKVLDTSTKSPAFLFVTECHPMAWKGGSKEGMCVCIWLLHSGTRKRPAQQSDAAILQFRTDRIRRTH